MWPNLIGITFSNALYIPRGNIFLSSRLLTNVQWQLFELFNRKRSDRYDRHGWKGPAHVSWNAFKRVRIKRIPRLFCHTVENYRCQSLSSGAKGKCFGDPGQPRALNHDHLRLPVLCHYQPSVIIVSFFRLFFSPNHRAEIQITSHSENSRSYLRILIKKIRDRYTGWTNIKKLRNCFVGIHKYYNVSIKLVRACWFKFNIDNN